MALTIVVLLALCTSAHAVVLSEDAKPSVYNELVCQLPDGSGGLCRAASDCPLAAPPQACLAKGLICCPSTSSPPSVAGVGLKSRQECEKSAQIGAVSECPPIEIIPNKNVADPGLFPYLAVLEHGDTSENNWKCGGVLVSESYVLTLGRCLYDPNGGGIVHRVRLGDVDLTSPNGDDETVQLIDVDAVIPHPLYRQNNQIHDVALLHLHTPAKLSPRVRPACLNPLAQLPTNHVIVAGFGYINSGLSTRGLARYVDLTVMPTLQCQKMNRLPIRVNESIICAADEAGGRGACKGDSGGPLQIRLDKPHCQFSVVGLTSFGPRVCEAPGIPSGYTSVAEYLSWIESIVWQ